MWHYILVFIASFLVDVSPFPLPPAFTVMIFFQIKYELNIWVVLAAGVTGSILGRYVLTLYIPHVTGRLFKKAKNDDVEYLGKRMKEKKIRGQLFILLYSLMPLPTTPLFIAGGMARLRPLFIIVPFMVGKFSSDLVAVLLGKFAAENTSSLLEGFFNWKSITGFALGLFLIFIIIFIDWKTLLIKGRLKMEFRVFRKPAGKKINRK
jgi:membrane protein YqaA with SNARE-associated domain